MKEINIDNILPVIYEERNVEKKNFKLKFYNALTRIKSEDNNIKNEEDYFNEYINRRIIEKTLPQPGEKTLILMCGRGKMIKDLVTPLLEEIGYGPENVFKFWFLDLDLALALALALIWIFIEYFILILLKVSIS